MSETKFRRFESAGLRGAKIIGDEKLAHISDKPKELSAEERAERISLRLEPATYNTHMISSGNGDYYHAYDVILRIGEIAELKDFIDRQNARMLETLRTAEKTAYERAAQYLIDYTCSVRFRTDTDNAYFTATIKQAASSIRQGARGCLK